MLDPGMPAGESSIPDVDPVTEQFRAIRTNLLAIPRESRPRLLALTSTRCGEGTTSIVHRLGASLAECGDLRVLLVDANLRQPGLDKYLADEADGGLTDALRGDGNAQDFICETVVENMDLLPSGLTPGNPSELLNSPRLEATLRDLRDEYDFVLVDTPSIRRATDASILGARCDSAMLVVQLHGTPQREIKHAVDQLKQAGVEVMGCVLTGAAEQPRSKRRYRYEQKMARRTDRVVD